MGWRPLSRGCTKRPRQGKASSSVSKGAAASQFSLPVNAESYLFGAWKLMVVTLATHLVVQVAVLCTQHPGVIISRRKRRKIPHLLPAEPSLATLLDRLVVA